MKRLSQPTGNVFGDSVSDESDSQVCRRAILVHAGPEGQPIEFMSGDGPIQFDADRIQRIVNIHNSRLEKLAQEYGGEEKIPMGAYEPLLDSHADDSNDKIIGRLTGPLKYEIRDVPKVGKNVPCAVADPGITFLGKDTVDRVKDGRIYHLSIGINENDDTLGETSTVVQPAAAGAMLLKKTQDNGGSKMSVQLKNTERLTKMTAMKELLSSSVAKADQTQNLIKLGARKEKITHRLTALAQKGRISRSEYKVMMEKDFKRLSEMNDDQLEFSLSLLDRIQPDSSRRLMTGQRGSTSANEVMEMGKELAKKREASELTHLKSETKSAMIKMAGGKRLFGDKEEQEPKDMEMESGPKEEPISVGKDEHDVPGQAGDEQQLSHHMEKLKHHLEAGDIEGAKKVHEEMSKHMGHGMKHMSEYAGDMKSEDQKAHMGEVQGQLDELKTNMSRLAGMVEELMGAEKDEGEHFGEISKEHEDIKK